MVAETANPRHTPMLKVPTLTDHQTADALLGSFAATIAAVAESTDPRKRATATALQAFVGQWRNTLLRKPKTKNQQ